MALLPLAPSHFSIAVGMSGRPVAVPVALRSLEDILALNWGVMETLGEDSPPSPALPPQPAPLPPGQP